MFTFSICIKAATWNKDSHGLFDYEDSTAKRQSFHARQIEYLIRLTSDADQVQLVTEKELNANRTDSTQVLLKIIPDKDNPKAYSIESCTKTGDYEEAIDKLWLVTKSLKKNGKKEVHQVIHGRNLG